MYMHGSMHVHACMGVHMYMQESIHVCIMKEHFPFCNVQFSLERNRLGSTNSLNLMHESIHVQ